MKEFLFVSAGVLASSVLFFIGITMFVIVFLFDFIKEMFGFSTDASYDHCSYHHRA